MSFTSIWRELTEARAGSQVIVQVRITTDAIEGSPVTTVLTPELASPCDRLREVVVHPCDWIDMLSDPEAVPAFQPALRPGDVDRVFGIPIEYHK